ncbi:hypothetical protein PInf_021421 [Phytophthora infestans]|nr:hypothetical protein PInf_021421 [Phytophthora infestans]
MATEMTTTEETENDGDTLAHEDVSGDVTRSVAERGYYAVSSGCTSGTGTGSSKQTTETTKETETFCRGYHYGNGHRDDHDGGNGKERRQALAREDVSGDVARSVAERGDYAVSSDCTTDNRDVRGDGDVLSRMTTTEETEKNGDSDERGRESLGTRRPWLNAVTTLCHLAVRVARALDRASRQPRRPRRRIRFVEGTTTEMATEMTTTEETEKNGDTLAREDVSGDVARSVAERGDYAVSSDCTTDNRDVRGDGDVLSRMTTTEETEKNGDSDERGRESLGTRRPWLNAVTTLCHLAVRVARALDRASRQPRRPRRRIRFVEGTTTEMATEMTTTEETEKNGDTLAREDVSGDVARSVAERGDYAVSSDCTSGAGTGSSKQTTETTEETETFCRGYHYGNGHRDDHDGGNGKRRRQALAHEDVSGDVTRSVAERGDYAVSSGCTSGTGTGSSKQTTETTKETETFCRGYHYGNGHRDDHDGGNGKERRQALAREDVSGDVARSVAERGDYAVSSDCTSGAGTGSSKQTTETSEETETFCRGTETVTSEDVRALAREDVSGDVARSVAERGDYAVSSGCTSGAGTGSSKQTTETSEETETFCRGYHYGNGHRDDHDGGNGNDGDTLAREDVTRCVAERGGDAVSSGCTGYAGTGSSKQTTETSEETETFCRGYHYGNGHRDDHDGGNGKRRRHVAERGDYAVSSDCTSGAGTGSSKQTTETTEETETFCRGYHYGNGHRDDHDGGNGNEGDTLAREDVSGDVTRSVAERGDYAVSSDCTSGAGTGSSKQTTETSEETETFCRGYHYRNGHRDDLDGGNGNDGDNLAREDVSGDVTRSVAERGGYAVSSGCTSGAGTGSSKQTTETTEATETFVEGTTTEMATEMTTTEETEKNGDTLAREDVSGDVARSVAERGDYAVSSDCTSGAGTGSSKQTTETTEETETFCRGYHYGNGHRDDHDGGNGNEGDTLAREDVSGDVTRSVAERGDYAVSSDCTSGAGTGSSKQTTETSEETETFCRGYHCGNGHRDDLDGGNGKRRRQDLAREDVSGDVARSVAERGGYAVSSDCTSGAGTGSSKQTTETTEATETFVEGTTTEMATEMTTTEETEKNGDTLARENVSGDVTRSVAERGDYAVSSDCTSGAGTGSSKQTTETSEETETFCRGYHYGNGHRDDHDGGNGKERRQALAREDVSGDVTRSVAERGGDAVSSGCTSYAGTGSSKQTTETSEETETFCRGYHYGNGHRDDHDGGNGKRRRQALVREDVSGDVTRSVAERCGYAVSSGCTSGAGTGSSKQTTETTEATETFVEGTTTEMATEMTTTEETEKNGDTLAREEQSGDVTRSVAERGDYAVSSDCTSGAGTGSSKQTTETTEETETFCRGYHYGNGHRDDHDGGNGNDGDTLAREDVSGDVTRSVAERGDYAVSSDCTSGAGTGSSKQTAETSEETETFCRGYHYGNGHRDDHDGGNGNDGDNLAREDVSGDVTRSVAERGGYAVSSDCTSGAGTGSSKQTAETSEETETFCRGYHYGNGHRDDHDGGNGNDGDTLAREDVSGDVTRSVAERGDYAVSSDCTSGAGTGSSKQTAETSEETETFCRGYHYGNGHRDDHDGGNGNDGDSDERGRESLAREDVSGDVTRSVAERGGYAVSSDCTSGAGTGSSKQTAETSEETETFCRGYHYGNGHRDDHDGGNGNDGDNLAREDVSGDVTRSVAERGGYAVSSDCTSGAGTGSSKQTTETTEETETFVEGTTTEMATEMTTTEETEKNGDSDERGRESLGTRRREWRRARSVAERGDYAVSSDSDNRDDRGDGDVLSRVPLRKWHRDDRRTEETENDGDSDERGRESLGTRREWRRARSVAERGDYAVSSDCTSGAGTGSSKQTTETTEETETFCRGYHYGNGHRDDHDGGNGNDGDSDERGRESLGTRRREWRRARSVAERGGYAVSSGCTSGAGTGSSKQTTETPRRRRRFVEGTTTEMATEMTTTEETETTETVTSEDVRALAREDVSGDVARSVAERGGYAVSSGCTSGAGTGSSKQTTETTEETETFCRGYHYGNGHRDDHDGGNGNDGDTLAREDVSGDVTRSVAERGDYAVSSDCTSGAGTGSSKQTTETTEETETFVEGTTTEMATEMTTTEETETTETVTSEDVRALAREDVTRSVAERGDYAVSSDCTSGAGTGSSKQTTETSEETETFCRGYHYGNGHRDDHDGGNGKRRRQALAREDVSGDVTRSVAERGGYAVSSDCTSGAGTGSSKQTTETTEETETFCRGYHYGNGHRDDHDGGNGNDGDTLAREDVSGDVTRSVAERGGYAVSSDCTSGAGTGSSKQTTETTEETETFVEGTTTEMATEMTTTEETETTETVTSEDVRALAREDVSGDVTRSVAERGGYAVSSDCTSGAGTGSSKQTTETTEETETFMTTTEETETTETVTSEDVRALAREDVTRSVAERGGYAVSSDCTSGAGTGSSKQTTETTEETETFVEGTTTEMATEMTTTEETETTETVTSEDVRALAREDVSGDVTRSVAERGGYAVSSDCTSGAGTGSSKQTTETTEETETFVEGTTTEMATEMTTTEETENDGDTLAREDVTRSVAERGGYAVSSDCTTDNRDDRGDGDVLSRMTTTEETENDGDSDERGRESLGTRRREWRRARSVAERGDYAVSSDCTSGAGTGSSKQTTETTEETETFCRGYHYGNGHRDDHDGGNGKRRRQALAREDVSGDVARSVAERGDYAVSSGCTSGAGTGSSKQTTETTEETETFCRGYHYGNGHRDDHDGGNGNDGDTLAREDVSGDVARSVAERGDYAVSSDCTSGAGTGSSKQTTETTEETETFVEGTTTEMATEMTTTEETEKTETVTSEDVRALAREDVSGDVARSVAERGDYAVSSDCTSGAGTGSSKQTTETSEETETFCRGYHYGNGHRDDHDGGNGNDGDTLAREDVSGDVTRSVAERGGYAVSSDRTSGAGTGSSKQTTETSEETETFCRGYHYGNGHRDDHDGGNGKRRRQALAREDVSGDVARSVAERGDYAVSSGCTSGAGTGSSKQTTETSEETETFCRGYHYGNGHRDDHDGGNGNDGDTLAREDVSGDVARSVAERGGYAVSSGCTSGAGTGSSKQTTETSEETETFCRGYHYGNGHRDDHDGGNGKRRRQ